jgi:nicotinamidase-related amidase
MNIQLLLIDPQNSFCDPEGSLFVPGADDDMRRLAKFIDRVGDKLDDIHVTLDSHRTIDVAHPVYWVNSQGQHPSVFSIISVQDVENGTWRTSNPNWQSRGLEYVKELEANNRYALCIWPEHCIIGSKGHAIFPEVSEALCEWERDNFAIVDYVTKGSNIYTEHYSAIKAEVEDPEDHTTMLNNDFLDVLEEADKIIVTGEALSHCVKSTILDALNFRQDLAKKIVLLEDTSSSVTGFEKEGEGFVDELKRLGAEISNTIDYLA